VCIVHGLRRTSVNRQTDRCYVCIDGYVRGLHVGHACKGRRLYFDKVQFVDYE